MCFFAVTVMRRWKVWWKNIKSGLSLSLIQLFLGIMISWLQISLFGSVLEVCLCIFGVGGALESIVAMLGMLIEEYEATLEINVILDCQLHRRLNGRTIWGLMIPYAKLIEKEPLMPKHKNCFNCFWAKSDLEV